MLLVAIRSGIDYPGRLPNDHVGNKIEDIPQYSLLQIDPENVETFVDVNNRFTFQYPSDVETHYSQYNTSWRNNSDDPMVFHMEKDEFVFRIELSRATDMDKVKLKDSRLSYKNGNIEGIIEMLNTRDARTNEYQDIQVMTLHDNTLYTFQLLGSIIVGRPPVYLPPSEKSQSIFHMILSTFEFHQPVRGFYEDEHISFSYPEEWQMIQSKREEKQFNLIVRNSNKDSGNGVFTFRLNGTVPEGDTYEETIQQELYHDTQYNGTSYVGYGDYSVNLSGSRQVLVGGKKGTDYTYYQEPQNSNVGAIHYIYIPIDSNRYYKIEYSGSDTSSLDTIVNSVIFK